MRREKRPTSASARRKRRAWNAFFCVLLAAGIGTGAFAASRLIPAHGQWEYENRREYLELPQLDLPCYLEVTVWHEGARPQGIQIGNGGFKVNRVHDDPVDEKSLRIWAEIDEDDIEDPDPSAWAMSLIPMDNLELTYKIDVRESYEHARNDIRFLTDKNGDRWLYVSASYAWPRDEEQDLRVLAHMEGMSYLPTVLDCRIPCQGGAVLANVTRIIQERSLRQDSAHSFSVSVMCGGTDQNGDPVQVNEKSQIRLSDWTDFGHSDWEDTEEARDVTDEYLDAVMPNRKPATESTSDASEVPPQPDGPET